MQGEEEENQERNLSISVSDALSSIFSDSLNLQEGTENKKSFKEMYINPTPEDHEILKNNLESKIKDGRGETIFEIGVDDNGVCLNLSEEEYNQFLSTLNSISDELSCDVTVFQERIKEVDKDKDKEKEKEKGQDGKSSFALIRKRATQDDLLEIRVAVVGNVDAGKSTMLGVLTRGNLDNGRGKARINVFRHPHERETGRTSSISHEILGFSSTGEIVTIHDPQSNTESPNPHAIASASSNQVKINWQHICHNSSKIITFIDLCGHEKYLKTTVFGLTGCAPDFVMLMVGANHGVIGMTKEHLGLALALNVPVFIVVTKIDMCPANILTETLTQLNKILKSPGCRKVPMFVNSMEDVLMTSRNFISERICPIFQVSNVTGQNINLLKQFLNLLPAHKGFDSNAPVEYQIDDVFLVPGVGSVVAGTVLSGTITMNQSLLLGPDSLGNFTPIQVKGIQRKRVNVNSMNAGSSGSIALRKVKRQTLRNGMVLVAKELNPKACFEFEAEILILFHSTTISCRYQAMVHCENVKQTAGIIGMENEVLRTGDRSKIRLRFRRQPEYIKPGSRLLFREGRTKAVGKVTRVFPLGTEDTPSSFQHFQPPGQQTGSYHYGPKSSKHSITSTATSSKT